MYTFTKTYCPNLQSEFNENFSIIQYLNLFLISVAIKKPIEYHGWLYVCAEG